MSFDFNAWIRQPSTLHGLGVAAGVIGASLSQIVTGNPTIDAVLAVTTYVFIHLAIDDHSASQAAMADLMRLALAKGAGASVTRVLGDVAESAQAFEPTTPATKEKTS